MFIMPGCKCHIIRSSMSTVEWIVVIVLGVSLMVGASTPRDIPQEKEHPLPITTEAGVMYYDLTQADTAEVTLVGSNGTVTGVNASVKCQVHTLVLHTNLTMDKTVAEKCPLRNVTFIGSLICTQILKWATRLTADVHVDYEQVTCTDVKIYKAKGRYNTVQSKLTDLLKDPLYVANEFFCPYECKCSWYMLDNDFYVNVDCDDAKLTDTTLPSLPEHTNSLTLSDNQITSMKNVLQHLEDQKKLKVLGLSGNQLTSISALPTGTLRNLQDIDISFNIITELDPMAVESIITRKGLLLHLDGNPLRCGCHLYHVNRLYHTYCGYPEYPCIGRYMYYRCYTGYENSTRPIWEMNDLSGCEKEPLHINYWLISAIIFGLLNVLMFWLIIDILLILCDYRGTKHTKRPKLDYVVSWFTILSRKTWTTNKNRNQGEETAMINLRDTPSHVRRSIRRSIDSCSYRKY